MRGHTIGSPIRGSELTLGCQNYEYSDINIEGPQIWNNSSWRLWPRSRKVSRLDVQQVYGEGLFVVSKMDWEVYSLILFVLFSGRYVGQWFDASALLGASTACQTVSQGSLTILCGNRFYGPENPIKGR